MSLAPQSFALLVPLAAALLVGCGGGEPSGQSTPDQTASDQAVSAPSATPESASADSATSDSTSLNGATLTSPATTPPPPATRSRSTPVAQPSSAASTAAAQSAGQTASQAATAPAAGGSAMVPMPGVVTRETELKAQPAVTAQTLRTLAANRPVTVTMRQGGWLQVTSGESRGWVRLLHVSTQPTAQTSGARQELEAAARVATGRAGSGNIAVTTGIRGLDEKELREAKADPEELKRLESLGAQPAQAQAHAQQRGLAQRQIPYPPPPQSR